MSYMDDYQLAQDEQEELKRRIQEWAYAPTAQAAPAQPTEQEIVNQMAAEQAAAQPQQVEMTPQIQPAQVQQQALPAPNNGLAATAAQFAPMSRAELMLAQQAHGLKGAWEEAQNAGDTETANRIHDMATALYKSAGDYGIDTSRFNSDVTRDQVGELLQANYAKAIEDVGNMITPQEYFNKVVDEQMAQGVSERAARKIAINQTRAYEGEYARKMAVAMDAYGLNDNGSMNNHSGLIQTLAYLNNPAGAAIYDRYYANPKDQWNYEKQLEAMGYAQGLKMSQADRNFEHTRALNSDKYAFEGDQAERNREHAMNMVNLQNTWKNMSEDKQRQFYIDYPEIAAAILGKRGGGGGGGNNGVSAAKQNEVMGKLAQLKSKLFNGDISVGDYQNQVSQYFPYMDEDTTQLTQEYPYVVNFLNAYKAGNDQEALGYWASIEDDDKLLREIPSDIVEDMRKRYANSKKNVSKERPAPKKDEAAEARAKEIIGENQAKLERTKAAENRDAAERQTQGQAAWERYKKQGQFW